MPNAKTADLAPGYKIIALGYAGAGKTTQLLTFQGKKFGYLFDPNSINSLQGYDVDYEEFYPRDINLDVKSLSKEKNDKKYKPTMETTSAEVYQEWEKDFEDRISKGFFDPYDWIMLDSFTTLSDLVMDEVLRLNGRPDQWPNQDDYGPQMLTLKNIVRTLTGMGKNVYVTGHLELQQDDLSKKIYQTPVMTGKLKAKLPLMFSEVLVFEAGTTSKGESNFVMQTKPTREIPLVRTSIKGLELYEDITIDWNKDPEGQGLGGILQWWEAQKKGGNKK